MALEDTNLEKLATYGSWLARLLPDRERPPEISVTDDMIRLAQFRVEEKEKGDASLSAGDTSELSPIGDFGANPYTEEEKKELSEIIADFNKRHGTDFREQDMVRGEHVKNDLLGEDMKDMMLNNAEDVVFNAFNDLFFKGLISSFQKDDEMQSALLSDTESREKFTRFFFKKALREVKTGG